MQVSLDTNVWIFGIVGVDSYCERLLWSLTRFNIVIPDQVREELERNLSDYDMKRFYQFVYQSGVHIDFERVPQTIIKIFEEKGLKKGDAEIGAFCEWRQIDILISDNRDFLKSLSPDRCFQVMSPQQFWEAFGEVEER
jgi:predicted nucleic acid-binding protein